MKQCSSVRLRIHSKFLERLSILQRFWAYPTTSRQKVWMVYPPVIQHNYRKRPMYGWSTYLKNHKWWFSIVMVQIGRGYHDSSTSPIIWLRNSSRSSTLRATGTWIAPSLSSLGFQAQGCEEWILHPCILGGPPGDAKRGVDGDPDRHPSRTSRRCLVL